MSDNTEELFSGMIGCGRAKIILQALEGKKPISEEEKSFLEGHSRQCDKCRERYEAVSKTASK